MNNTVNNDSSVWAGFRRAFYIVAALLAALLLLLWLMGYGPGGAACKAPAAAAMAPAVTPPALSTATAPTSVAAAPAAVAPAVVAAAPAVASAAAPAQVATPAATTAATSAAAAVPAAKVYFAVDKFVLPAGTDKTLAEVVGFLKKTDGAKAHVTGFHDPSGSVAHNEELAHNRARAVRGALEAQGIARDRIVMDKPSVTTGSGEPREARRVEVRVE